MPQGIWTFFWSKVMANHILKAQQYDHGGLIRLMNKTDRIRDMFKSPRRLELVEPGSSHKHMILLFYEPSTRTRISFQMAAHHLGIQTATTENAGEFSSAAKGESLEDTIHVLCRYYPNVIVLRHTEEGAAERAAVIADKYDVSIINAGDGKGQHPTQALLDIYTIRDAIGTIEDRTILMGGDLKHGRTVRSLAYLLSKFKGVKIIFLSLPELTMNDDLLKHLSDHGTYVEVHTDTGKLHELLAKSDVVYWTRFQDERATDNVSELATAYRKLTLGPTELKVMKKLSVILHPLPRIGEISTEVDNDPRAGYLTQAENGLFVRMALLEDL